MNEILNEIEKKIEINFDVEKITDLLKSYIYEILDDNDLDTEITIKLGSLLNKSNSDIILYKLENELRGYCYVDINYTNSSITVSD